MNKDVNIRLCEVISDEDPAEAGRITVKFNGVDDEPQWCFPLLPKLVHVRPKPGETVAVIVENSDSTHDNRYYVGPVLSQPYFYEYEGFKTTSLNALTDSRGELAENPGNNEEFKSTFPSPEDVALLGRKNTEVRLKENEVRILCGKQENPTHPDLKSRLNFNLVSPAYIQMKYYQDGTKRTRNLGTDDRYNSVINIGADKINFISRSGNTAVTKRLTDPNEIWTDEEINGLNGFINNSHPMVYGDVLANFLKKFLRLFQTHTHPFAKKPPIFTSADMDIFMPSSVEDIKAEYIRLS